MAKPLPSIEAALAGAGKAHFNTPNHGPLPKLSPKRERQVRNKDLSGQMHRPGWMAHMDEVTGESAPIQATATRVHQDVRMTPEARARMSTGTKIGIGAAGGGTVAAGGYGAHKLVQSRRKRESAMSKSMINPFEEVVVFGKAVALPVPSSVRIRTPNLNSGSHRGNALALVRVHNSRGGGGPATALERYTTSPRGGKQGPFGRKGNSKIPDGARVGVRIGKRSDDKPSSGSPSVGRRAAAAGGGVFHPMVAGRRGQKAKATGSTLAHQLGGSAPGAAVAALAARKGHVKTALAGNAASYAGFYGGGQVAVGANHRKGRLKAER